MKKNTAGQLHCSNGPAAKWPSGEEYWFLNGIQVSAWVVKTDAGKIDAKKAIEEKNVDVQREIIRKIGAERMLKALDAKPIDTFTDSHTKGGNEYKLMEMKIGNINRKYLYFEHASVPGLWYAQPIPPTIKKALHGRAWILGIGEVDELEKSSDEKILAHLPVQVS